MEKIDVVKEEQIERPGSGLSHSPAEITVVWKRVVAGQKRNKWCSSDSGAQKGGPGKGMNWGLMWYLVVLFSWYLKTQEKG